MNKWEYHTLNAAGTAGLYERQLREKLNELGQQRWELCGSHNGILIFKRLRLRSKTIGGYSAIAEE